MPKRPIEFVFQNVAYIVSGYKTGYRGQNSGAIDAEIKIVVFPKALHNSEETGVSKCFCLGQFLMKKGLFQTNEK